MTKHILRVLTALAFTIVTASANGLFSGEKLSLQIESVPLRTVLDMIAEQHNLNIVVSGEIDQKVTLRLENVDIAAAFDALLSSNQLNYYVNNDVIVVKPVEMDAAGELSSRLVVLRYIDPITAQKALDAHKSVKGHVVILDKSGAQDAESVKGFKANRILISDFPSVVESQLKLIEEIDKPEQLIKISVKIIESQLDSASKLGFVWPSSITTNLGSNADSGSSTSSGLSSSAVQYNPNNGNWTWGTLNVEQMTLLLNFLQTNNTTKLISDPYITVTENFEAEIKSQTIIPIQTINRFTEGAATSDIVTFEDEEVGISLNVTPRINEQGRITLDVMPKVENIVGFSGPPDNQKPIKSSRSIKTRVTVNDGETLALGGLLSEEEVKIKQRVPLLGSIPIIGSLLFTHHNTQRKKADLIILITPTIVH
jgi:type IV pilus assembly protein PilQ